MEDRRPDIPLIGGGSMTLDLSSGQRITIVGPNGAGKSALSASLSGSLGGEGVNRIFAHRRLWLSSSATGMAPNQRAIYEQNSSMWDSQVESRWNDRSDGYRAPAIISDLVDRQNHENSIIADRVRSKEPTEGLATDGPMQILNSLLRGAALEVQVHVNRKSELIATNSDGQQYPAAEMSDGEKAALLLVADVLASDTGSIHLIDEPERHLHRAISAPLIASLTQLRPSDTFVTFTHDLELAQELGVTGETYVVTGCTWEGKDPRAWALERVPSSGSIAESLRRAVLGGRRKIVFHEGTETSIDQVLYKSLLVGCHLVPIGSCGAVLRSVGGLRDSEQLHWIDAAGIVDRDFRRDDTPSGVRRLTVHEAENVFYLPEVIQFMSVKQAASLGLDASDLIASADEAMKGALLDPGVKANILGKKRLQQVRDDLADQLLSITSLSGLGEVAIAATPDGEELASEYDALLKEGMGAFLGKFPIRESAARSQAARAIKYPNADIYEQAVIQQLRLDADFRDGIVRALGIDGL